MDYFTDEETGAKVREMVDDASLKHAEVAQALGLSPSSFSKILTGGRRLTVSELAQLGDLLGVDPLDLVRSPASAFSFRADSDADLAGAAEMCDRLIENVLTLEAFAPRR